MQYFLIAFAVTFLVLILLLKTRLANIALDQPNHRSLHSKVTPRTGGLAIMAGLMAGWLLIAPAWEWMAALAILVAISLIDDIRGLSVRWRLASQLLVGFLFVSALMPHAAWWQMALLALAITWMMNLYNFMDGSDGLAGGMAIFGFSSYALAAYLAGDLQIALMCGCIVATCVAFLLFNFNPARIFMGDAGSIPLGFLAGAMGIYGWHAGLWPAWFPVMVFSPFIVDATVTLLKRSVRGEKIWQAHRSHYYQRLIQMGWSHRKTALHEYALMLAVGASALLLLNQGAFVIWIGFAFWVLAYALVLLKIDRLWQRSETAAAEIG